MAGGLSIELLRSTRGKDKSAIQEFAYTLVKSVGEIKQWTGKKRGVYKARFQTRDNLVVNQHLFMNLKIFILMDEILTNM